MSADGGIRIDPIRGHITIIPTEADRHRASVTFTDLGSVLSLWSWEGIELTPALAIELGEALVAWGRRKKG